MHRLGVVSFLNARPLIEGLSDRGGVELTPDVPARLEALLSAGRVDAALLPIVDVLRSGGAYRVVSDACIGCDGETMTVRVFSQVPPDRIRRLHADTDSHTSVALARVLWRELYDRELELIPLDARRGAIDSCEAVLLIGDKVIDPRRGGFAYETDLGGAWKAHTGLPFVFAVWAAKSSEDRVANGELVRNRAARDLLGELLSSARDRGVARAADIARAQGPALGWPIELAERYLTRCLRFTLDAQMVAGATLFGRLCAGEGLVPGDAELAWPGELLADAAR